MQKKKKGFGLIIFMLIIFWPVGLYMLFKRLYQNDEDILFHAKVIRVLGFIAIGLGVAFLFSEVEQYNSQTTFEELLTTLIGAAIFVAPGAYLIYSGNKRIILGTIFEKYPPIIRYSDGSIRQIARMADVSEDQAMADLKTLIELDLLDRSYIDYQQRRLYSPLLMNRSRTIPKVKSICPYCGGVNSSEGGGIRVCEYCNMTY